MKKATILLMAAMILTGCKSTGLSQNESTEYVTEKTPDVSVKYVMPNSILNKNIGVSGVNLYQGRRGSDDKRYSTAIYEVDESTFKVKQKTYNMMKDSGYISIINYSTETDGNNTTVTLKPIEIKSYKEGVFPFSLPKLDITEYLSNLRFPYEFEINSDYPSKSVMSSLDRLLKQNGSKNSYHLKLKNNSFAAIKVEAFPYRNGSKIVIKSTIITHKNENNIINLDHIISELEATVKAAVNS